MDEKRPIDLFGATALIGFAILLGGNQVVMKVTNAGFAPVFQAGIRSVLACLFLALVMRVRGQSLRIPRHILPWGVLAGISHPSRARRSSFTRCPSGWGSPPISCSRASV